MVEFDKQISWDDLNRAFTNICKGITENVFDFGEIRASLLYKMCFVQTGENSIELPKENELIHAPKYYINFSYNSNGQVVLLGDYIIVSHYKKR